MNRIEVLKEARNLIADGWCKYSGAKDCNLDNVPVESSRATSYCTFGAIDRGCAKLYGEDATTEMADIFSYFSKVNGIVNVIKWNDDMNRTKEEVLLAFDNAIHCAEWEKSCKENTVVKC
jgi:hypothetical protein